MTIPLLATSLCHNQQVSTKRSEPRVWLYVLLGAYLVVAALIAFWPTPVDAGAGPWLSRLLGELHSQGLPGWITYDLLEFAANVVFFIPLTILLTLLIGGSRWWFAVLVAVAGSMAIEVGQMLFVAARFATLQDVAANALGALVGAGTVIAATKRREKIAEG